MLISCAVLLISTFYGPEFWSRQLYEIFPEWILNSGFNFDFRQIYLKHFAFWVIIFLILFTQLPISLIRVYKVCKEKKLNFFQAISGLFPFLGLCFLSGLWISSPMSFAVKEYTIPLFIAIGFVFAQLTVSFCLLKRKTRVIVAHVAGLKFPNLYFDLIPVVIGCILSNSYRLEFIM